MNLSPSEVRLMVMTTSHETLGAFFDRQLAFFAAQGFQVLAVSSPGPGLDKFRNYPGIQVRAVAMERKPHPLRDLISLIALLRLTWSFRPHIVHAHTPKAGLLGMFSAAVARVPVRLYTLHGLPLLTRSGWVCSVLKMAERVACGLSTRTYCISPSLEALVRDLKLCTGSKLSTLGDGSCAGVDLERYNPDASASRRQEFRHTYGIPASAPLLCYVGRVAKDKGIEVLAAAWKELSVRFGDLRLMLIGASDPTDPVPAAVMDTLRSDPRVCLTGGWLSVDDMPSVYAAADICVLPTFREGLSQVALESAAMGVPIVGTRIPGLVNAVSDGVTGLLVPPGDAPAFAAAIARLLNEEELRLRLGRAGREFARARFSEERVNQLILGEYLTFLTPSQCAEPAERIAG